MNKGQKEKRETPITDGDARPDMSLNPDERKVAEERKKKKFEKERMSDVNSLEDYKDAELNDSEERPNSHD